MRFNSINKDRLGAAICIVLGTAVVVAGARYGVGTMHSMGAGFIPVSIGALLIVVGIAIAVIASLPARAAPAADDGHGHGHAARGPEWRGWAGILGGLGAFVLFGTWGGLVPGSFMSVFVAAMGDKESTIKGSAGLAAILTVFSVAVFHYVLQLSLPLFHWS
jgi:hypothetical protein